MTMSCNDAGTKPVRRFEVFTGAGHRREWSDETRAAIIAESYSGAESVSAVARRHALAPSQLFTWRHEFRRAAQAADIVSTLVSEPEPFFVPAVIDPPSMSVAPGRTPVVRKRRARRAWEATAGGSRRYTSTPGEAARRAPGRAGRTAASAADRRKS